MTQSNILKLLLDYFPTAVHTGQCIVFVSENRKVELWEHQIPRFGQHGQNIPVIRVKVFKKALNDDFVPGHYQDFQIDSISELAAQIERYIQYAVGQNIQENV